MDENKKSANASGSHKPPIAKVPQNDNNSGEFDYFSRVYKQQKDEKQTENEKTVAPESNILTVANEDESKNEKIKIALIFLITIIIVLFLASCTYLLINNTSLFKGTGDISDEEQPMYVSAKLESPFTYQSIYDVTFPEGIQDKYKALYAQNTDFVGWLTVPGTCIDTPVYQQDNNDYYLKHDNYGTYTKYGIPFLDRYDSLQPLSRNTVIYGHNFDNKLIFDELHNYQSLEFFKENPIIEFNTIYGDYKWKVIAAFHTNGDDSGDNGYLFYYVATEMGDNSFMKMYDELLQRSYIITGVDAIPTDKILTLSTCTYFFDTNGAVRNARFVVVARLIREGESEDIDFSLAKENTNVRYPQLYYTAYGGTNPFANASKWEPEAD